MLIKLQCSIFCFFAAHIIIAPIFGYYQHGGPRWRRVEPAKSKLLGPGRVVPSCVHNKKKELGGSHNQFTVGGKSALQLQGESIRYSLQTRNC
jgi:hypothetical protein